MFFCFQDYFLIWFFPLETAEKMGYNTGVYL